LVYAIYGALVYLNPSNYPWKLSGSYLQWWRGACSS